MQISYNTLPVYEQKQRILDTLAENQVIVVQSPTGSGKTTQLPVILHEAGYSKNGVIAVTQPRRIAALSVSEFIAKQLKIEYPGLVGYKMRFEDKTDNTTLIKIMTDGILLQEMKLDPWLSKYSVVMVDEAHERSLNIDFVLGLLKRILPDRPDLKVIVSSATMNAEAFSEYFDFCPIVTIDTITHPVTVIYDPPGITASTASPSAEEELLMKIEDIIDRVISNRHPGDILCFLPGEKVIKDCMKRLSHATFSRKIHLVPLYGRLAKEEQERVFDPAPFGRRKVIISTNIAETSVTIPGITTVIDSGLAKMNFYNPRTYTSSLTETTISKASCNQRKGRAGRTGPGICYRLYPKKDYDTRPIYTTEEIYRTDLSEVVMRMSELGITDFEQFHFISPPPREGMRSAVETLNMLEALNPDNTLSKTGLIMAKFPLLPRISRIITEAILRYPEVMEQSLIAAAFLSAQTPFVLPPGEEADARQAHHRFRDILGDFMTYVTLYNLFTKAEDTEEFCNMNYLDERVMLEIVNIKQQLEQIVSKDGIPILSSGSTDDYLCCVAAGLIQFVCIRSDKESYRTLTAENIQIHPGSGLFRTSPLYIVAGEIVRTSRMFAMTVSPLTKTILHKLSGDIEKQLQSVRDYKDDDFAGGSGVFLGNAPYGAGSSGGKKKAKGTDANSRRKGGKDAAEDSLTDENSVCIGNTRFEVKKFKGKKNVILPWKKLHDELVANPEADITTKSSGVKNMKGVIQMNSYTLLAGEKLDLILKLSKNLDFSILPDDKWNRKMNAHFPENKVEIAAALDKILRVTEAKAKSRELGFICLFTDGNGTYWMKVSRGFSTALNESLSSLETLIDESAGEFTEEQKARLNAVYRKLHDLYE
ncbi:MAG: ATP-dependent RNA helicase [Spirochaetaceae bacterium]|nr:ATP-dependent RNA helicase [Spirochaetaceae bacterium]